MPNARILFVDDDPAILEGLRLALRKQRHVWDMAFAGGGIEALALLEKQPVDIVVSDMRMPGMDGPELLGRVRQRWPSAIRLVLSGHADGDSIMRALPMAHQFLNKPLQAEVLQAVVARAIKLKQLSDRPEVQTLVGRIGDLPSLPGTYTEIIRIIQDPKSSLSDISQVVEKDPLVSAKILQLVNSAYFGFGREVFSVQAAISLLGPHVLLGVALASTVLETADTRPEIHDLLRGLQERALRCCAWTRQLSLQGPLKDEAATTALIHDLGTILLALADPQGYREALKQANGDHWEATRLEAVAFGATHAEIGAYLFGLWGLPLSVVEAVASHHDQGPLGEGDLTLAAAVHAADALERLQVHGGDPAALVNKELLKRGGLDAAYERLARGPMPHGPE